MRIVASLIALLLTASGGVARAAPFGTLGASYAATVPATGAADTVLHIPVTVQNTGDETWNAAAPGPVLLTYHWLGADGAILIWEGVRTGLGQDVLPGSSRTISATVQAPKWAGAYQLRFHLVKEGVVWFPQMSSGYPIDIRSPYAVRFGNVPIFTYISGATHTLNVPLTNSGTTAWNAGGANPVRLAYHWFDADGRLIVWDGERTNLTADVPSGSSITLNARVVAPTTSPVTLKIDMVREGMAWFEFLGGTPVQFNTTVEGARWSARYDAPPSASTKASFETIILPVTITNTGNVAWDAAGGFAVSYHVYDGAGRLLTWDGRRTSIGGELRAGETRTVSVTYNLPTDSGTYDLHTEVVREGVAWLSTYGSPPVATRLTVVD